MNDAVNFAWLEVQHPKNNELGKHWRNAMKGRKWIALALSAALCIVPFQTGEKTGSLSIATVSAEDRNDMPSDYATACDWIWTNRIEREGSMKD